MDTENDPVRLQETVDDDHDDDGDDKEVNNEVDDGGAALSYALGELILKAQETTLSRLEQK